MPVRDYERIEKAILFLEQNFRHQPSLGETAKAAGLSEFHFQRLFKRWAGVSPKRFLQYLTIEHAKGGLCDGKTALEATYDAGLSGPGRLHDLFVAVEAVTPGEFKARGKGLTIAYGFHPTPFGDCLLSTTEKGVSGLEFVSNNDEGSLLAGLRRRWRGATLREDRQTTGAIAARIFRANGSDPHLLTLFVKGTNFQLKVWTALLRLPPGHVVCYQDVARSIGQPAAVRAVGAAVRRNPVAFVIPCHRVIRKSGALGDYRWGTPRKKAILGWEAARLSYKDV